MKALPAIFLLLLMLTGRAQFAAPTPPRETPLLEKKWEDIDPSGISAKGNQALQIDPDQWRHAETPNFYLHFRRATEARKVAREIEFNLVVIAGTLEAPPEKYARKSHVYIFEDQKEWETFLKSTDLPQWSSSVAVGDELFLNVRGSAQNGGGFDSQTLAHETTHAVVARIYGQARWPLWLSEGFAEYMGGAAVARRKNQQVARHQDRLDFADLSVEKLGSMEAYPQSPQEVTQLYQSSERLVRFLMEIGSPKLFLTLVDQLTAGQALTEVLPGVYGAKYPTFADFEKAYEKFGRRH